MIASNFLNIGKKDQNIGNKANKKSTCVFKMSGNYLASYLQKTKTRKLIASVLSDIKNGAPGRSRTDMDYTSEGF